MKPSRQKRVSGQTPANETAAKLALLQEFRARIANLTRHIDEFDLHGLSQQDQAPFWETFVADGEALIRVFRRLVKQQGGSARDRLLNHFLKHVGEVIEGETLESVAGVSSWSRRVRELDVEFGYNIVTHEGDPSLRPGQYRLDSPQPDLHRAQQWQLKNSLRNDESKSVQEKLLALLLNNVGSPVDVADLEYVANQKEWTRRLRDLRWKSGGWRISSHLNRPDLQPNQYLLEGSKEIPASFRIEAEVWASILERDHFTCRSCGWSKSDTPVNGKRSLEVLPKPRTTRKGNEALETLCNSCYERRITEFASAQS